MSRRIKTNLYPVARQDGVIGNLIRLFRGNGGVLPLHCLDGVFGCAGCNLQGFLLIANTKGDVFDGCHTAVANHLARRRSGALFVDRHDKHAVAVEGRDVQAQANRLTFRNDGVNLFPLNTIKGAVHLLRGGRCERGKVDRDGLVFVDQLIKLFGSDLAALQSLCGSS